MEDRKMKIAVRYYSKTGNTKKLADAIAKVAGVKAETVDVKIEGDIDILFLGSSVYAAGIDPKIKEFIATLSPKVKKVVNFSTAAILKSTFGQVSKLLVEQKIQVDPREYHCRGSFSFSRITSRFLFISLSFMSMPPILLFLF